MLCSAEVADALADGRAVVALESTLLAHGLPAPAQPGRRRRAGGRGAGGRRGAGDRRGAGRRRPGSGCRPAELDRVCAGGLAKLSAARPRAGGRAGPGRGDDGGRDRGAGARGRDRGVRHRRARRACTAGPARRWDVSADLAALAAHPGAGGLLGGEVDPGRRRPPSRCWRPCRCRCSATAPTPSPASTGGTRGIRSAGGSTRRPQAAAVWRAHRALGGRLRGGAGPAGPGGRRAGRGPARASCWRDGLALLAERGVTGKDVTPALLEHFHTAQRRGEPARQPRAGGGERPAGRPRSRWQDWPRTGLIGGLSPRSPDGRAVRAAGGRPGSG